MKQFQSGMRGFKICMLFFAFFIAFGVHAGEPVKANDTCLGPSPYKSGQTSTSLSYAWSPVSDGATYVVYYVNLDLNQTSSVYHTSGTSITLSGLTTGHYKVYFASDCGGEVSSYIVIDEIFP